jgi:hypothetical protein
MTLWLCAKPVHPVSSTFAEPALLKISTATGQEFAPGVEVAVGVAPPPPGVDVAPPPGVEVTPSTGVDVAPLPGVDVGATPVGVRTGVAVATTFPRLASYETSH